MNSPEGGEYIDLTTISDNEETTKDTKYTTLDGVTPRAQPYTDLDQNDSPNIHGEEDGGHCMSMGNGQGESPDIEETYIDMADTATKRETVQQDDETEEEQYASMSGTNIE